MNRLPLCALLLASVAACTDAAGPNSSAIRVLSSRGVTDTILALVASPFTVEIRDGSGRPVPGASVRFDTQRSATDTSGARRTLYACEPVRALCAQTVGDGGFGVWTGATVTTDDHGRASATVQHGIVAGPAALMVSALGDSISIAYTTLPGALNRIVIDQRDTAVYVGSSYHLHAYAADVFGNARAEEVSIRSVTPSVAGTSSGSVAALGMGRGIIVAKIGTLSDTAFVSVPPHGRLATFGWAPDLSTISQVTLVNTDGSDQRVIARVIGNDGSDTPAWTSTGDRVVFENWTPTLGEFLGIADTLGALRPLLDSAIFHEAIQPAFAAGSGDLYFFSASNTFGMGGIYRANGDGTDATFMFLGVQPAPSPDGSRIAYIVSGSDGVLMIRDAATGHVTTIASSVAEPQWSPDGTWIAFIGPGGNSVQVARPDGTGLRTFNGAADAHVSWSPDGAWLAVAGYVGGLRLIRVEDGASLPIAGTSTLLKPSWQP